MANTTKTLIIYLNALKSQYQDRLEYYEECLKKSPKAFKDLYIGNIEAVKACIVDIDLKLDFINPKITR